MGKLQLLSGNYRISIADIQAMVGKSILENGTTGHLGKTCPMKFINLSAVLNFKLERTPNQTQKQVVFPLE
jgi:hypothetical protein